MKKQSPLIFEGTFSWDKPIEEEILDFVRKMASQMERAAQDHSSKQIRGGASHYADAYRTVERHILKEIRLRQDIVQQ